MRDLDSALVYSQHWNETTAQQNGTIRRETGTPESPGRCILSGPHIQVGNLFFQTANPGCSSHRDYSRVDLTNIPSDYLPRVNYTPSCSHEVLQKRVPRIGNDTIDKHYRLVTRAMMGTNDRRTLVCTILPPRLSHIHGCFSITSKNYHDIILLYWICSSLCVDFMIKATGKENFRKNIAENIPIPFDGPYKLEYIPRVLRLTSLSTDFAALWSEVSACQSIEFAPVVLDARVPTYKMSESQWTWDSAIRTDLARRNTLLELDVLAAIALGFSCEQLVGIYTAYFPVLQQHDNSALYDQTGRIVPRKVQETAKKLGIDVSSPLDLTKYEGPVSAVGEVDTPGLGVTGGIRWEDPKMEPRMERIYPPPFTTCDREADMRQAYRVFLDRLGMTEPE